MRDDAQKDIKVEENLGGQTKSLMNMDESHVQPPDLYPSLQERTAVHHSRRPHNYARHLPL